MKINFTKYQGTGNDFVMLNNLSGLYDDISEDDVRFLCDRKKGIGSDGLIKLNKSESVDFEMEYFNSDGSKSFCGNGARCSVAFASELGLIKSKTQFTAIDGVHQAELIGSTIKLEMLAVKSIVKYNDDYILNTGSPHYVRVTNSANNLDIVQFGASIRYSDNFIQNGINVNTLQLVSANVISVETYERGVENETLSCGTGVTACALVYMYLHDLSDSQIQVQTKGGLLTVQAIKSDLGYSNIWLSGPAMKIFDGTIDV